jgi:type I site-specific restriction endonuclease
MNRVFLLVVLEAKSEDKNPLIGKEQARKYAKSQNCRFVILSNGNLHYFRDLQQGSPHIITRFPTPESIKGYHRFEPNPEYLIYKPVDRDYIVLFAHRNDYTSLIYKECRDDWRKAEIVVTTVQSLFFNGK